MQVPHEKEAAAAESEQPGGHVTRGEEKTSLNYEAGFCRFVSEPRQNRASATWLQLKRKGEP